MLNFNAWKLTQRYTIVFIAYWISMVAVIVMSWTGLMSARDSLKALHGQSMQRIMMADDLTQGTLQSRMQVLLAAQHAPGSELASLHDHPTTTHFDAVKAQLAKNQQIVSRMQALPSDAQEKVLLDKLAQADQAWSNQLQGYLREMGAGDFSTNMMGRFLATGRAEGEDVVRLASEFKALQEHKADLAYQEAEQRYHWGVLIFLAAIVFGGVPASLLSWSLLQRMRQGFEQAQATAQSIAAGDISRRVQVTGKDEISNLLGHMEAMRTHLHQVIAQVRTGADAIAGASTQVAAGTQDLSSRTEQQAASLEETASATEELSSTVQQNADSAVRASELARQATGVAQQGGSMVAQVVQTMEEINASSRKIEDIIAVIDGIAFQTNILALNAAVEAARAGEQGRGFAVVAGEVRSLAKRSADAAKEVKQLINNSVDRVRIGTEQVDRTGATMQDIVNGIQRVAHIVGEIADASREQAKGLVQINSAVANLDDVTQQNAALVEETSAASNALQDQARQLAHMASSFVLEAGNVSASYGPTSLGGSGAIPAPRTAVRTAPRPQVRASGEAPAAVSEREPIALQ